jgi:glycosyltransferase 2 family protein
MELPARTGCRSERQEKYQREALRSGRRDRVKTAVLFALKVAASIGLLWVVLRHLDFGQTSSQLLKASPLPLLFALLTSVAPLPLVAWRWQLILRIGGFTAGLWRLLGHTWIGIFFSQALPSTVGGDGVRAWLVYRDGASASQAIRSVLIERLLGLAILVVFAAAGFPWLLTRLNWGLTLWPAEAIVACGLSVGLLSLWAIKQSRWMKDVRFGRALYALADDATAILLRPNAAVPFGLLSFFGHVLGCLTVWAISIAIGSNLSLVTTLIVMPTIFALVALPISIAGWGVREGAMAFGLGLFGVTAGDAVLISVLFGLLNLAVGLIGLVIWLLRQERIELRMPAGELRVSTGSVSTEAGPTSRKLL